MTSAYQIYRSTTIGLALDEALEEFVQRQVFTPRIASYILNVFDDVINQKLTCQSSKRKNESCLIFKGHLLSYRSCDQVWTLLFNRLTFTSNGNSSFKVTLTSQNDKIKIIACPVLKLISPDIE